MLDFFTIFSKGGIVLWCFQGAGVTESFTGPVNALIRSVILQERGGNNSFTHEALSLKYKLDNEFELIFVVGFQKILTLTYVDKFIDDVQLHFRDRYKNELEQKGTLKLLNSTFAFEDAFSELLKLAEESRVREIPKNYDDDDEEEEEEGEVEEEVKKNGDEEVDQNRKVDGGQVDDLSAAERESLLRNELRPAIKPFKGNKLFLRFATQDDKKEMGAARRSRYYMKYGNPNYGGMKGILSNSWKRRYHNRRIQRDVIKSKKPLIGDSMGHTPPYTHRHSADLVNLPEEPIKEEEEEEEVVIRGTSKISPKKGGGFGGMFGMLKGLVGSKSLSRDDMEPVLEKMRDHLIAKNVAADIASQLCDSVAKKLEGKVMGTFTTVASTVKQALQDSLVQILQPKRRVDILRDVMDAQSQRRPFVITFCGVNGVGKSTNLAKISYWLIENGFSVLIAACDTFRAGAVEQLRTHQRRLNSLHPPEKHGGRPVVQLYEKGYGKDAAGIAMEAIAYARNQAFDVVLVDTAGRMQDNAPLMTALAKLIAVNMPDLVLFVGEALVGNEAVDQLVKFNQALADHSMSDKPRLIDGIVLTKFDTIDDKVGAAISMTYITGQPIVFVGTGQTYNDLRSLNARAVVSALMKA
uniref:Signal recognition particle receptor (Docking protein) n=1 Tax=Nothobranchius rachovii TaxID=451742 RepID=A0A1A8PSZ3_9TELE